MFEVGDLIELKEDADVYARIKKQLAGRVGVVTQAWDPINGHPSFWQQCSVRFDPQGRKKEVTLDLMFNWLNIVAKKSG